MADVYSSKLGDWLRNTSDLKRCRISWSRDVILVGGVNSTLRHMTVESVICRRLLALQPLSALSPASANSSMRGLLQMAASRVSSCCFLSAGVSVCDLSLSAFSACTSDAVVSRDLAALRWLRVSIRDCSLSSSVELVACLCCCCW